MSLVALTAGLAIIAVGEHYLQALDDHMGEYSPERYYAVGGHYGKIAWTGALICLTACVGLALVMKRAVAFRTAGWSVAIAFGWMIFGLFVFPVHGATGAIYFALLAAAFGASLIFGLLATIRYAWRRTHANPEPN